MSSACFHANQSYFPKNGFMLTFALKQRHEGNQKWPIGLIASKFVLGLAVIEFPGGGH